MRFEVAPLPLDVVVCFFLWTGIVPSLWEFVWNVSRNGICLYYYLVYPSLGRLYFTHNSGWHPDRALFRYSPNALVNLYGSVIDARWVSVLQVNKGTFHMPGQMISKTGNEMEDKLEELADILASLSDMTQGVKFPAVAVTPIAIFREI